MYAAVARKEDEKEVVEIGGQILDWDWVLQFVDAPLFYEAQTFAGYGATAQGILDEYLRLHERRHGAPFVLPQI
jgi:hypothetical protein